MKVKPLILAFLAVGFGETVSQVLMIRELMTNFQGNELTLGVILANWLFLIAVGSWTLGRAADRVPARASVFVITQILFCLILPVQILLARGINNLIGVKPGEMVGLLPIFYSSFLLLAPVCVLIGAQFALGCRILAAGAETPAREVGKIYVAEALGCMIGGAGFTYLLVHRFHAFEIALLAVLLNLMAGVILLRPWQQPQELLTRFLVGPIILILGLGVQSWLSGNLDRVEQLSREWQWKGYHLVHHQDSVYGNIAATESEGQTSFYFSGLLAFTSPDPDIVFVEEMAHYPLLSHPAPQAVLLVGGGIGGVLEEILKHPIDRVDYVELDPLMIEAARKYSSAQALDDPRVRIIHTDARVFVRHAREEYDVIIVSLPPPSTLQLNRAYTKEFFQEVVERLSLEGIFSFGVPASEAYMSREMIEHNRSIYETTSAVFSHVSVIPGDWTVLLASPSALEPGEIPHRFEERDLETRLLNVPYLKYRLSPERTERLLIPYLADQAPINRDLRPIATYHNLALWNAMFYPAWGRFFAWMSGLDLWWALTPAALLVLVLTAIRRKAGEARFRNAAVILAIASTGFAGMTLNIVLMLVFQIFHGLLYQRIGVLVAAFMLGLALGALAMAGIVENVRRDVRALVSTEVAIIGYAILLPFLVMRLPEIADLSRLLPQETPLTLLNCLAGLLVGLQFPLANKIYLGTSQGGFGRVAGGLYASDLTGAVFGALLTSVFLIPILGIRGTCLTVVIFKLASLALLIGVA